MSFFDLKHYDIGFTDTEWEGTTPNEKRIIRDWVLNGRNHPRTVIYDFYEDDSTVRKVINKYDLPNRPYMQIRISCLNIY